jgi:parallel beta-helix repeat protein
VTITTNNLQIIAQGSDVTVSPPEAKPGFDVNADRVTVRGFEITGEVCASGITFKGSHNIFAENMIHFFQGPCGARAIQCVDDDGGSDYNTIESNSLSGWEGAGFYYGIYILASSDALNEGNVIKNNSIMDVDSAGIFVGNGTGFQISGNIIEHIHTGHCILVEASNNASQGHHRILKNTMFGCARAGILLHASSGTVLAHNHISDNEIIRCGEDCLALEAGTGAALTHSHVMSNTVGMSYANGIHLSAGQDAAVNGNLILDNLVYGNIIDGISLTTGSDHNRILNNEVQTNHKVGVAVAGDNNSVVGNWIWNNETDLEDTGVGNMWRNNTVSD